ncbi:altronate dehydratase family protein [uncultured Sphaerochaeta sp.]|uniref:UxaA family hydrolase n=1 Tax=uncultured Sphaerochaeta sp. TaxID=886478 RepID=UPI002A0A8D3E|nr:altronate dehydratase family protein [uncultured Sphaerochaeta sp.]
MEHFKILQITAEDIVAVAIEPLAKGQIIKVGNKTITCIEDIPPGHKMALRDIAKGEKIIKYGYPIGEAREAIAQGSHVHANNIHTLLQEANEYSYDEKIAKSFMDKAETMKKTWKDKIPTIKAYQRKNGEIGIRNEIWIVPTVGCVNKIAENLIEWAKTALSGYKFDGIHVWSHPYGCSQLGADHEATRTILSDLVHHPNAGGVLVLSLGCENNTPESFKALVGPTDPDRVKYLICQEVEDELATGKKLLTELAETLSKDTRVPVPMSKLIVGFKCGGSDGFSGITANPLVGRFCDELTAMGGTSILTEVPEMFGAEQLLMNRAINKEVFDQTVNLINDFKDYFVKHNQVIYENPSPGNKAGGISTLEDKSLGCIQKGGQAPVEAVLNYGDRVTHSGLNLLSGPGNDIVSTTALTACGAHLILFTTGRGTPLGAPVPTVKIASNSAMAEKKANWIDFDAGRLLREDNENVLSDLLTLIEEVASGTYLAKNEQNGYAEISLFKDGVIL